MGRITVPPVRFHQSNDVAHVAGETRRSALTHRKLTDARAKNNSERRLSILCCWAQATFSVILLTYKEKITNGLGHYSRHARLPEATQTPGERRAQQRSSQNKQLTTNQECS